MVAKVTPLSPVRSINRLFLLLPLAPMVVTNTRTPATPATPAAPPAVTPLHVNGGSAQGRLEQLAGHLLSPVEIAAPTAPAIPIVNVDVPVLRVYLNGTDTTHRNKVLPLFTPLFTLTLSSPYSHWSLIGGTKSRDIRSPFSLSLSLSPTPGVT